MSTNVFRCCMLFHKCLNQQTHSQQMTEERSSCTAYGISKQIYLHPISGASFIIFVTESTPGSLWKHLFTFICSLKECLGFQQQLLFTVLSKIYFWKRNSVNLINEQLGKKVLRAQVEEKIKWELTWLLEWGLSVGNVWIYLSLCSSSRPPLLLLFFHIHALSTQSIIQHAVFTGCTSHSAGCIASL